MERLEFNVDFANDEVTTGITNETFKCERTHNNHLTLPINVPEMDEEVLILKNCSRQEKMKKIQRIHKVMCHPKIETMRTFFQDSSENMEDILDIERQIYNDCAV